MTLRKNMIIFKRVLITFILLITMMQPITSFGDSKQAEANPSDGFKVIGYYCGEWFDVPVENLQAEQLTHVMYGFLIPKEDGTCKPFEEPEELKQLINKCHSVGTKVFVSVGGYREKDGTPLFYVFEKIGADEELRKVFVDNVIEVVEQYGFDGVELDWEYPTYKASSVLKKRLSNYLRS